jgi:hypothetical protein
MPRSRAYAAGCIITSNCIQEKFSFYMSGNLVKITVRTMMDQLAFISRAIRCSMASFLLAHPAQAQLFEIAAPSFSAYVTDDGNYTPIGPAVGGKIPRSSLSRGLLYFSFTVIGGEQAMEYLRSNRRLDVDVVILTEEQSERISGLGISQQKWNEKENAWISQFNKSGFFTFRTYMNTQKIGRDTVELQVRDARGHIVRPVAHGSAAYRAIVTITP